MLGVVCPRCSNDCSGYDNVLVRSVDCGHGVCDKCLSERYPIRLSASGEVIWNVGPKALVVCPLCETACAREGWVDWNSERSLMEKTELVRKRVTMVLNGDRESFKNTPLFNEFLEEREQVIYDLVFSADADTRREREEYLKQCEVTRQKETLEANERQRKRTENRIKQIVESEGTFFERLMLDDALLKKGADQAGAAELLVHPLVNQHAELFPEFSASNISAAAAAESQTSDLIAVLRQHLPSVMTDHVRKIGDSRARALAGGYHKDTVLARTLQETFAFRLDLDLDAVI